MENNMFGQLLDTIRCKSQNMEVDQLTACVNEYFRVIKGMSTIIPPNEEDIIVATTLENEPPSQVDQQIERCMICKCSLGFHEFIGDDSEKAWKDECREGNSILLRAKSRYWTLNRQMAKLKDELQESESKRWQTLRTLATIYTHLESKRLRKKVDKLLLFLNISTEKEKQSLTGFEGKKECVEQYEKCKSDLVQDISTQDFEEAKRICFVDMGTRLHRNDKAENAIESSF